MRACIGVKDPNCLWYIRKEWSYFTDNIKGLIKKEEKKITDVNCSSLNRA